MRVFALYANERTPIDVPNGMRVVDVKKIVEDTVCLDASYYVGDNTKSLALVYAGGELEDDWVFTDVILNPGATIRVNLKELVFAALSIHLSHNDKTIEISFSDDINMSEVTVENLRTRIARETGIPVGAFYLMTEKSNGKEMFDQNTLSVYDVKRGQTVYMKTWEDWDTFLKYATIGFTHGVEDELKHDDEKVARYQMKVALYIAAHFGHDELAEWLINQGIKAHEWVGDHPYRQWCQMTEHIDCKRTPVHEAAHFGRIGVLRRFVLDNEFAVTARDGDGVLPLSYALRNKQKKCAGYLLAKSWSRIEFENVTIPISLCAKIKFWAERAKERAYWKYGQEKSSLKRKPFFDHGVLVGIEGSGINVDGFPKKNTLIKKDLPDYLKGAIPGWGDPEGYFYAVNNDIHLPKIHRNKFDRLMSKGSLTHSDSRKTVQIEEQGKRDSLRPIQSGRKHSGRPRSGDITSARIRLPPIKSGRAGSSHEMAAPTDANQPTRDAKSKAAFIQTGKIKEEEKGSISLKAKKRYRAKAKTIDAPIPLPEISRENKMRPYVYARSKSEDPMTTLNLYEKYRGMKARDYAIKCLSIANTFKDKPWLKQVRMALTFGEFGVKKAFNRSLNDNRKQETRKI